MQKKITIYSPHFFQRYRERILKKPDMLMNDVIEDYLKNSWGLVSLLITKDLASVYQCFEDHYRDEMIDFVAATGCDGYCFGEKHGEVSIVKTIISKEMLRERQRDFYLELEKKTEMIREAYDASLSL